MKTVKLFNSLLLCLLVVTATAFKPFNSLKGVWIYEGGIYNNKAEGPPKEYRLERRYNDTGYEAFIIQEGTKTEKYEAGNYNYSPEDRAYRETQTFSSQPSTLIGKEINYTCSFRGSTLIFKGKLFDGTQVEEYWKKVK